MPVSGNKTNEQTAESTTKVGRVKVKTTTTSVLAENQARLGAQFVNEGANSIFLELGTTAVLQKGIFLAASGGSWNGMVGPMVWTGPVAGIAETAETSLTVIEV